MNLMPQYIIKTLRSLSLLFMLLFVTIDAFSFTLGPGDGPPCGGPFGPCIPIDGGISFLLIAGAAYGSKRAFDFWKEPK
jgi:hypothetical protein